MHRVKFIWLLIVSLQLGAQTNAPRQVIQLNGVWQFEQSFTAFPPFAFTRNIPVPGLIHLASPLIDDYEQFFRRPEKTVIKMAHNLLALDYTPRYSWYKRKVFIPANYKNLYGVISIKKSQYVTQVFVNGQDLGGSMACYTPVEFPLRALKYGEENEILIRLGDRAWLPSAAAGSTDKEKEHYLPGIWDDVELSFTHAIRIDRTLLLPSVQGKTVTVKSLLRNFNPSQINYGDAMYDTSQFLVTIREKLSGKMIAQVKHPIITKRDNQTEFSCTISLDSFKLWSPEAPFLYAAEVQILTEGMRSDQVVKNFGMRDFTRKGKYFYLNGEKIILSGTNLTLHRFFEDPDCGALVWDRAWVKKLLVDYPKQLHWNAMRVCVGILPDFWYDLADEAGIMFQNEWLYWQNHGWDAQIRQEYTDWIWSDGSHPSIVIWDAINENWDDFIGKQLIPELKELDPTRIWDAGYMTSDHMILDEMDEPHPYQGPLPWMTPELFNKNPYPLGNLDYHPEMIQRMEVSSAAQLINEYGWVWLWRNGQPSKLTLDVYKYYLGPQSTPDQNREFQAYWLQLETEWLRVGTQAAGVLAFCYLANNYGYTGDWFIDQIRDLKPSPTIHWFKHAFAPAATFINLTDERYTKHVPPHRPGSMLHFNLYGLNHQAQLSQGQVAVHLYNPAGQKVYAQELEIKLAPFITTKIPIQIKLPRTKGGYTLVAKYQPAQGEPVLSRRYLKIGSLPAYSYSEINPLMP